MPVTVPWVTPDEAAATFVEMVGAQIRSAVAEMSEHIDDATEWEVAASSILPLELAGLPDEVLDAAVELVRDSPGGRSALRGMAAGASPVLASRALAHLAEVDPDWSVPALEVDSAWQIANDEPMTAIGLVCRRAGVEQPQLFSFLLEHDESAGAIKSGMAMPASKSELAIEAAQNEARRNGLEPTDLDPSAAFSEVVEAARRGALRGFRPDDDGLDALAVLLRAGGVENAETLLAELEAGEPFEPAAGFDDLPSDDPLDREIDRICDIAYGWFCARGLGEEELDSAIEVAELWAEYRLRALDADVTEAKRDELDQFVLRWVPQRVQLPQGRVDAFTGNLAAVLEFLAGTFELEPRTARSLGKRALSHNAAFRKLMETHGGVVEGPAATIAAQMDADGVDLRNPEEVARWIEEFNGRSFEERDRLLGQSLERFAGPPASSDRRGQRRDG